MSTPAIKFLKQRKIAFEVLRYEHAEKGAEFAAKATGYPLAQTVKTLVVDLGQKGYTLVLSTGDKQLSMKRLARVCGVKQAAMADTKTAERLTGYLIGGISPFGTKHRLPVIMDESILGFDKILINGGQRGRMLMVAPGDIQTSLACTVANVAQP
jgi:Cys-tRNA(Pro)/Cys-tRNA(Cys) deacylase